MTRTDLRVDKGRYNSIGCGGCATCGLPCASLACFFYLFQCLQDGGKKDNAWYVASEDFNTQVGKKYTAAIYGWTQLDVLAFGLPMRSATPWVWSGAPVSCFQFQVAICRCLCRFWFGSWFRLSGRVSAILRPKLRKERKRGIQESVATRLWCSRCSRSISIFFTCQFAGSSPPTVLCQIENVVQQAVIQTEQAKTKQKRKNCPQKSKHLKQDLNVFTKI